MKMDAGMDLINFSAKVEWVSCFECRISDV